MAPVPRGSWTLDEAVKKQWDDSGVETKIREYWPVADKTATYYPVLHDGEARPVPPGPYVVYEKMTPVVIGHMSGMDGVQSENQLQSVLLQFTVHAKSNSSISGKYVARKIAGLVADAFDPDTSPWPIEDDTMVSVLRGPDFHVREGDEEWAWVLQYEVMIDATYLQA